MLRDFVLSKTGGEESHCRDRTATHVARDETRVGARAPGARPCRPSGNPVIAPTLRGHCALYLGASQDHMVHLLLALAVRAPSVSLGVARSGRGRTLRLSGRPPSEELLFADWRQADGRAPLVPRGEPALELGPLEELVEAQEVVGPLRRLARAEEGRARI